MRKIVFVLLSFVVSLLLASCSSEEEALILTEKSPNGVYSVSLYQVAEPAGAFSSVKAKLVLENQSGDKICEESFDLANDGGGVIKENITEINWFEDCVEISLIEKETNHKLKYVLNYF